VKRLFLIKYNKVHTKHPLSHHEEIHLRGISAFLVKKCCCTYTAIVNSEDDNVKYTMGKYHKKFILSRIAKLRSEHIVFYTIYNFAGSLELNDTLQTPICM